MSEPSEVFSIKTHLGRFAVLRATSEQQARQRLWATAGRLDDSDDQHTVELNKSQLSMVYAQLLGKHLTANNVVYLFNPEQVAAASVDLASLAQQLKRFHPLIACRVVQVQGEYAFDLDPLPPATLLLTDVPTFQSLEDCVEHFLQQPLSLFKDDLFYLFKVRIGETLHLGACLHHILGNHVGQFNVLRSVQQLAQQLPGTGQPADFSFVSNNLMLADEYERQVDACSADWEAQSHRYTRLARLPALPANAKALQLRAPLAVDSLALEGPQRLAQLLQVYRQSCAAALGIQAAIVNVLVDWADSSVTSGFSTYTVPIALEPTDSHLQQQVAQLNTTLAQALLGYEEILGALQLYDFTPSFLFNLVALTSQDAAWLQRYIANPVTEKPKTLLDLTLIKSALGHEVLLNSYLPAALAESFLACFVAGVKQL
ncbi:hypothetical protein EXN22_14355 [Pseudomonas tructae]|uniref:Condensation domain-containing protein n=1 Tax=Pseudomonas tructae TaxID=2518644 RepID=A0A411MJ44_9PSED|nr:hypothetical protein [Pseudomonas tructae]QBF26816.1 hypothetical protein EXN22_14355 [Pseudomonas tructae]